MSLSKIGKVSNAVKLLNTAATSGDIATGISSLSNSLRAAGNMSAGVNWISKYGKVLDSGIAYQALKQAFPEESLTEDMLAKIGYTANGAGKVGNASKFSSVGSTFAGLGTFLKSIWPVLAVVGGIAAGTAAWKWADDKFTITKATAKKHSDESAQAYQNAKTELSTKQSQYDTNQDRIHELRATQNRTSDENAELSQLTKENSLLGTQVSVQKKLVDAKAQQQAIDADGQFINQYESISEAVRQLNIPINRTCLDVSHCYADIRKNSSHGYRWCDTYYNKLPPLLQRGKPIVQFNNNMQIINIFNNMNIAINETSESRSTITNSSNKNRLTKRGYYWKFASDISSDNLNFINEDIKEKYYGMTA